MSLFMSGLHIYTYSMEQVYSQNVKISYLVVTCNHIGYLKYVVSKALAFSPTIAASFLPVRL